MDSYAERRNYVRQLFNAPVLSAVGRVHNPSPVAEREPTGWERVDRSLGKAKAQFNAASTEEEWQTVGLLGREILISLGQAVYDPDVHGDTDMDGKKIGSTDARSSSSLGFIIKCPVATTRKSAPTSRQQSILRSTFSTAGLPHVSSPRCVSRRLLQR